jgi:CheY-like chemotaxis protein
VRFILSGLGEGVNFSVILSLNFSGTANANEISMKKTILVVDDDDSVREAVNKVLRGAGYEVVLAAGGLEAVVRFQTHAIDLVVLDIGLPNQNGWETCKHLALSQPNVPIILITGHGGQSHFAFEAGAAALMEKPLGAHQLLEMIHDLVDAPKDSTSDRSNGKFYHIAA